MKNYSLSRGDVAAQDRGLCHAAGIWEKKNEGADVIARYNPTVMPLYFDAGTPLELISYLKNNFQADTNTEKLFKKVNSKKKDVLPAGPEAKLEGHLIVLQLPIETAKAARKRCRKQASKKGRNKPTPETLFIAGFLMVFTTLSPEILSAQTVLKLYKCRWQIEIAILLIKSLLDIDKLRSKEGLTADIWLNGKLLYAIVLENHMRRQLGDDWGYLNEERRGSKWRPLKLLERKIEPIITGVQFWKSENWADCLSVLFERPRHRKLQTLPLCVRKRLPFYPSLTVPSLL